jgi:2'-5' RNA ligase
MTAPIHSIWLMPAAQDGSLLSGIVTGLSQRFGTPLFTPHLTVRGDTDMPLPALTAAIAETASKVAAFSEIVAGIETSEAFFRSFYARFAVAPSLATLKQQLDGQATEAFMPHVSLLYGPVAAALKAEAAAEVATSLAGRPIRFDRLCVVTSGQDVPIDQWRIVGTASLA